MAIPFTTAFEFRYAELQPVSPLVRRLLARNPGPFTFHGTGTYVVGRGEVAVIDPGPLLDEHIDALLTALRGETISHIVVTHTHRDHSPASGPLQQVCGAPSYGFGPHGSGRAGGSGPPFVDDAVVEEAADYDFVPDRIVGDGDLLRGSNWTLESVHTPGHTSNHLCFRLDEENTLFSGDHVMGWSTTVISPPDGDMGDYLDSLQRLLARVERRYLPTHGGAVDNPRALVRALIRHRTLRARQIVDAVATGAGDVPSLLDRVYHGLDPRLRPAAARSLLASLVYLVRRRELQCDGDPTLDGVYRLPV